VDVIVSDGYSGNIFLKAVEGTGLFMAKELKKMLTRNIVSKIAAVMLSGGIKDFKKLLDSREVGGTALLGISKPVIKAHGSSKAKAFKNAIRQAVQYYNSGVIYEISQALEQAKTEASAENGGAAE
jgi:glycerol-3-phosphate acyltransferase PlsX